MSAGFRAALVAHSIPSGGRSAVSSRVATERARSGFGGSSQALLGKRARAIVALVDEAFGNAELADLIEALVDRLDARSPDCDCEPDVLEGAL